MNPRIPYEAVEKNYIMNTPREHRKKYGQYFTPAEVAMLMCRWVLGAEKKESILDPALGLGIFFRKINEAEPGLSNARFTGYETDRTMAEACRQVQPASLSPVLEINCTDYLTSSWDYRYDCIVCNPPYIKFRNYESKGELLDLVEKHVGVKLSGFANIYVLFLLKSLYQLSSGGRAAFIVPSEFLNADYGSAVKKYLVDSGMLRCVAVVDFSSGVFGNAVTTSSILLFENDRCMDKINFISLKNANELDLLGNYIDNYPLDGTIGASTSRAELDPNRKWSNLYNPRKECDYKALVPFARYAHVYRGIATGCNDFFVFNKSKALKYGISNKYLTDCICSSSDVKGHFIDKAGFSKLKNREADTLLLNIQGELDEAVMEYISLGEKNGVNQRYLTRNRKPWFSTEQRAPAPILAAVFNRGGLRFVRNEASVKNLTSFHCIYPEAGYGYLFNIMMAYFLTDISKEIFDFQRREYGNGLEKFEPNDLNKAYLPAFELIDGNLTSGIIQLYETIKKKEIDNVDTSLECCELNRIFTQFISRKDSSNELNCG